MNKLLIVVTLLIAVLSFFNLAAWHIRIDNKTDRELKAFIVPVKDIGKNPVVQPNPLIEFLLDSHRTRTYNIPVWQENFGRYEVNVGVVQQPFYSWILPLKGSTQLKVDEHEGQLTLWFKNTGDSDWQEVAR